MKYKDLKNKIESLYPTIPVIVCDAEYEELTKRDFETIIKADHTDELKYLKDLEDCDDFAWLFRSIVIRTAVLLSNSLPDQKSFPVGWAIGYFKNTKGRHSINCVILDNEFYWFEPQNDELWKSCNDDEPEIIII